jgi:ABC-type branched-subunit amino acid transport system ATPase component
MNLLTQFLCLFVASLFGPAIAYDTASAIALAQLATATNTTTIDIMNLNGCGYTSTTQAIEEQSTISDGSACPTSDTTILGFLTKLSQGISAVTQELASFQDLSVAKCRFLTIIQAASHSSNEASSTVVINAFNSVSFSRYSM